MNLYIISGVYHLYKWTKISLLNLRHILTRGTISLSPISRDQVYLGYAMARPDDKPRALSSSLEYCRGAEEEDEVKTSVFIRTFLTPSKNHQ